MPTRDQVLEALNAVIDPELHRNIVELGMVRSIDITEQGSVNVTVSLTTAGCTIKSASQNGGATAVQGAAGVPAVNIGFDTLTADEKAGLQRSLGRPNGLPEGALAQVENVICIGAGKGGVGQASLTV